MPSIAPLRVTRALAAHTRSLAGRTAAAAALHARLHPEAGGRVGAATTRLLFVSDVHNNPQAYALMSALVGVLDIAAVIDTGDSTDRGTALEHRVHEVIATLPVPYLWVRGNHDSRGTQERLAALPNVVALDDGATTEVAGIRLAGTGDPRHAPGRRTTAQRRTDAAALLGAGEALARAVDAAGGVAVALVHEPAMAVPLFGHVPLVLDGHVHERRHRVRAGTVELTQGSSGAAGLRAMARGSLLPLELSVLHLHAVTGALVAVDELTVDGPAQERVTLLRRAPSSYH